MKIYYPTRSRFLGDCKETIRQNKASLMTGVPVSIKFSPKGYNGKIRVSIQKTNHKSFNTNWAGTDETRFPVRIKAAAYALFREGCFGDFIISHKTGILTIQYLSSTSKNEENNEQKAVFHAEPKKENGTETSIPTRYEYDSKGKEQLVEIFTKIPWGAWERIMSDEPEWKEMDPFLKNYDYGSFAVLMLTTGLNDYQLKGKAEIAYWPKIHILLEKSPIPKSPVELCNILEPFYQQERLNSQKTYRLRTFLESSLVEKLWGSSPHEVAEKFFDIWQQLAQIMGQKPQDKTISFAMKCLGISLLMVKQYKFDFTSIPIPVDLRVVRFTRKTNITTTKNPQDIRNTWNDILSLLQLTYPDLTMIHLDSLIWQIASKDGNELKEYFDKLQISLLGMQLSDLLKKKITKQSLVKEDYNNKNVLILIPCCKLKIANPKYGSFSESLTKLESIRNQLLELLKHTPELANESKNQEGILNDKAEFTIALDLYSPGRFYNKTYDVLNDLLNGRFPFVHVLIVSAFYGLAKLDEGLKIYDLEMKNSLSNGIKVFQFWQYKNLWKILQDYIDNKNITHVWSLLPDSPSYPYQQVFNEYWSKVKNSHIKCYHVKVPGAGSGTGLKRAEWFLEIMKSNPKFLIENPPPSRFDSIEGFEFDYILC